MAKHIIGLILFSLIVGVSVFVSGVTNYSTSVDVGKSYRLLKKKKKRKKKRRCRPHRRSVDVSLNQVTFDRDSAVLSTHFDPMRHSRRYRDVKLHFFAKNGHGTNFLKTEFIGYRGRDVNVSKELPWLSRLDAGQNIYVIAEASGSRKSWTYSPEFDASKAVPVTMSVD